MIRLIVPLTFAAVAFHAGQALAQNAFPAPLPGQTAVPASGTFPAEKWAPSPPEKWAPSDGCMKGFAPLREEADQRTKLIKAASDRKASPDEVCKLVGNYSQAEVKMIKYIEANAATCRVPPQITDQLKAGHNKTESLLKTVCAVAQQAKGREPAGPVGDFDHLVPHR